MNKPSFCPFFGANAEKCDVGTGYITPFHVETMVRHCTATYETCGRYQELTARSEAGAARTVEEQKLIEDQARGSQPTGGLMLPLKIDRDAYTIVHHELRTPLTSIRSFSEILLNYPIDDLEAQRKFLRVIQKEAQRLCNTLDLMFGLKTDDVAASSIGTRSDSGDRDPQQ